MRLEWLIPTTLETSVLIGIVLLSRPIVLRVFGAHASYSLWVIPILGVLLPTRPQRPVIPLELAPRAIVDSSREAYSSAQSAAEALMGPFGWSWASLWILGIAVWIATQAFRTQTFRRQLRSTGPVGNLPRRVHDLLHECGLTADSVVTTKSRHAPFVSGLIRTRVFLPSDFAKRFSASELAWVVSHELAHIRRGDLWTRLLAEGFRAIFWFNPLVHVAVAVFRRDQEYACDLTVIGSSSRQERYEYGKALLAGANGGDVTAFPAFFGNTKERYIMLGRHKKSLRQLVMGFSACAVLGALSLTSSPSLLAQSNATSAYDLESLITVQGAVVKVTRQVQSLELTVFLSSSAQDGTAQHWEVAFGDELDDFVANSERPNPFEMGEELVVRGHPSIDTESQMLLATSMLRLANGGEE